MKSRPSVLFPVLQPGFKAEADWGPAILIRALGEGLERSGSNVARLTSAGQVILVQDGFREKRSPRPVGLAWTGNRLYRLFESGVRFLQTRLRLPYFGIFDNLRAYEACRRLLPEYQICHEYYSLFGVGALLAARSRGVPHILLVDADLIQESDLAGARLRGLQRLAAIRIARFLFARTTRILCVSEAAKGHFIDAWGVPAEKIAVLPNGVEARFFARTGSRQQRRAELGLSHAVVIIFVGSFQPWHGIDVLLEIFPEIQLKFPQAVLLLVGDGPDRSRIEAAAARSGLAGSVRLVGLQPHETIPDWLELADIAVAPYPKLPDELWFSPLKLYEYMAAGKAIVATASGQIKEVIETGRNGILVEPGDADGFAEAIMGLIADPEKRAALGRCASRQAGAMHTWDAVIDRLQHTYQEALETYEKT